MKKIIASNRFLKFKKKSANKLQLEIDNQLKKIIHTPNIGELKKGDLKSIRVHKFKYQDLQYLISYEVKEDSLYLYLIDTHENYYNKLRKYLP